jgi:nitroreductase
MEPSTTTAIARLIRRRISGEKFDPEHVLTDEEIRSLAEVGGESPSSFHLQHWRFVAVREREDKERLCRASFGQHQVADAAVTFIVLGDLRATEHLPEIMDLTVARGAIPPGKAAAWIDNARKIYSDPRVARDEAIRSGSLAAMLMILEAEERGLATCPISGFDPPTVMREFGIPDRYVPVMLLAVGRAAQTPVPRKPRLPVEELLRFDRWS